jgi:hypothetical protein
VGTKVQLPPGCKGFDCKDGTRYTASRPGGSVTVSDRHADALKKSQFAGDGHLVGNIGRESFGTKRTMRCESCRRLWNAWNDTCPRCGEVTVEV